MQVTDLPGVLVHSVQTHLFGRNNIRRVNLADGEVSEAFIPPFCPLFLSLIFPKDFDVLNDSPQLESSGTVQIQFDV